MAGFQARTTVQPAVGVEGDFASANPRFSVMAGAGAFVAGALGVYVGRFAWAKETRIDDVGAPAVVDSFGAGPVTGFVHREMQAALTAYLQESSMLIPAGWGLTLMNGGDFFVKNTGANQAQPGMKAYANFLDGSVTFAATGTPTAGGTSTASTIAAGTNSANGTINGNVFTATDTLTGVLYDGSLLSGTGVATGTRIVDQVLPLLPGEALRGLGRYYVSIPEQVVASTLISGTYGLMTIGGTVAGTFAVGQPVSGAATPAAGTVITDVGTGLGQAGTYIVNLTQTVGSGALNTSTNVETKWVAMSFGLQNELVKISDHPLG
ncbi:hypothetical protein LJR220_003345 [Bradyrhizobium sp. LjRoot220]|uniref:gp53 minor capsid family protein n=1 Tax=Bradyrhizobium sp. LjRoot220 TaxID=3342284 RepID=UPI003ECC6BBE